MIYVPLNFYPPAPIKDQVFSWGRFNVRQIEMRFLWFTIVVFFLTFTSPLWAGPAPYSDAKIYIIDTMGGELYPPATVDYIRKHADIVISLGIYTVDFFGELNWENAKLDPSVKKRAKPLVMIIDFYDRVQPIPPEKPAFDTLYCTRQYCYSKDGYYIDITRFTARTFKLPLKR